MFQRLPQPFGQCISLVGAALTTAFQGGTAVAISGAEEIDVELLATFDASTTLTNQIFQLQVSDDNSNWEPVATTLASTGAAPATSQTLNASAGTTVRDRMQISSASLTTFRNAKYVRVAAKCTGTVKTGDSAVANLNYTILG